MVNTQGSPAKKPLATAQISEREFRRIAGLCLKCGLARAERGDECCEQCNLVKRHAA